MLLTCFKRWWQTCTGYETYQDVAVYPQDDSGLKKRWPPALEYSATH